ncbi:dihydrolipoamide acetyltransferase [Novipirellula caenicola]|uniref:Flagellar basal body-associated protein FliL n=1 Tax=Novipirellula caenicola TaxID=1536901 RepID=A0ABP9VNA3_9BACT
MADEKETTENGDGEAVVPKKAAVGRGLVIAFVGVIVLIESAMFFLMVPSAEEVSALAEAKLIKSVQEGEVEAEKKADDENEVKEIDLGTFGETFSPIDTEREYTIELHLYGLIRKKNSDAMDAELAEKQGRLRHAIRMKIRTSALTELQENQLGLLERRILTTSNHLLAEDYLLGVGFHDYQLREE